MGLSVGLKCKKCNQEVTMTTPSIMHCGCGYSVYSRDPRSKQWRIAQTKQWRIAQTERALASLNEAIKQLQFLVDSYSESEGPFSGCHPRSAYESQLKTLREQAKSLAKGRV